MKREDKRRYIYDFLSDNPCVDCGEIDPTVLSFDHVRGDKIDSVSRMVSSNRRIELIKDEMAKCEIRCHNCHARKTARDRGWYAWLRDQD